MKGESMALTHEAILSEKGQANIQIHSDPISAVIVSIMPWVSWRKDMGPSGSKEWNMERILGRFPGGADV